MIYLSRELIYPSIYRTYLSIYLSIYGTNLSIYLQEYARCQKIAPGQWSAMVLVEEPFDRTNAARAVCSAVKWKLIQSVFQVSSKLYTYIYYIIFIILASSNGLEVSNVILFSILLIFTYPIHKSQPFMSFDLNICREKVLFFF